MTRMCWGLVDIVSRMLEPDERDAVLGDLAESGETDGQALRDLLGLVVRRQAALWKDWRPWLPDTFLIDRQGRIAAVYRTGLVDKDDVEANIRALLSKH